MLQTCSGISRATGVVATKEQSPMCRDFRRTSKAFLTETEDQESTIRPPKDPGAIRSYKRRMATDARSFDQARPRIKQAQESSVLLRDQDRGPKQNVLL
jgi:hypothetical protein